VLWFYVVPGNEFWVTVPQAEVNYAGPFVYANAAGFFLYVSLAVGLALAFLVRERARSDGRDSGFYWVILIGCAVVMSGLLISGSRGGLVVGGFILLAGLGKLAWENLHEQGFSLLGLLPGAGLLLAMVAALACLFIVVKPKSLTRLVWDTASVKDNGRLELWRPSVMMIKDRPWLGFGGGSFRYISPFYFRKAGVFTDPNSYDGLNRRADRAHSDWLEFVVQYGGLGAIWPLLMLLYWAGHAMRMARWLGAAGWMVLLGLLMVVLHAAADFPFFCAPVVTLFTVLLCATMKLAQLNRSIEMGQ
jgi:O-antigen ligase